MTITNNLLRLMLLNQATRRIQEKETSLFPASRGNAVFAERHLEHPNGRTGSPERRDVRPVVDPQVRGICAHNLSGAEETPVSHSDFNPRESDGQMVLAAIIVITAGVLAMALAIKLLIAIL